jgi:periplasmic protein CpxP/Spy
VKYYLHGLIIGFFVTTLWVTPVVGQDLGGLESLVTGSTRGDGPGTLVLLLLKGIGLTAEQKQQVREILTAHRESLEISFRDLQAAQATLSKTLFAAEEISAADVAPHAERVTQLRQQLLQEGLQVVLEVRQVLTPEQRAKAARLREQLRTLQGALVAPSPRQKGNVR